MTLHRLWPLLILCAAFAAPPALASTPSPEAQALIAELGLTPSTTPISKHPGWKPKRVVVMLLPAMGTAAPDFEQDLKKAAGDVELVFDRSGSFVVPAELLAGADAVIGICTPPLLKTRGCRACCGYTTTAWEWSTARASAKPNDSTWCLATTNACPDRPSPNTPSPCCWR